MAKGVHSFGFLLVVLASVVYSSSKNSIEGDVQHYVSGSAGEETLALDTLSRQRRDVSSNVTTTSATVTTSKPTTPTPRTESPTLGPYPLVEDHHDYYTSQVVSDGRQYWMDLDPSLEHIITHKTLSDSFKTAVAIKLPFDFTFYGHKQRKVTIATGGFLYMSDFLHQFLTATQYIAPLMANFDSSLGDDSNIHYYVNKEDKYLVVEWDNLHLNDQKDLGQFSFQAQLYDFGKIVFAYNQIPSAVANFSPKKHPVKIGASDAYYMDYYVPDLGVNKRTIYEYHKVEINTTLIRSGSAVIIQPLPTCNILTDCNSCKNQYLPNFKCGWCPFLARCSDGMDRGRQEWQRSKCQDKLNDCDYVPTTVAPKRQDSVGDGGVVTGIIFAVVVLLMLIIGFISWVVYAYRNPETRSGQWLIRNRPREVAKRIKFWKKSEDTGDKYAVSLDNQSSSA